MIDEADEVLSEKSELNLPVGMDVRAAPSRLLAAQQVWLSLLDGPALQEKLDVIRQNEQQSLSDIPQLIADMVTAFLGGRPASSPAVEQPSRSSSRGTGREALHALQI